MRFDAVLFDCDGVLVDSEPITNGVLRDMLHENGWTMTRQECLDLFVGKAVRDERALIEKNTGKPLTDEWLAGFWKRRNVQLELLLVPIEGAAEAVAKIHRIHDGRIACASGADLHKVQLQLRKTGMFQFFEDRIFSGHDTPRSKPFPDVYLAAAAYIDADPTRCAVIEDTITGVTAGIAAGATVFGYAPDGDGSKLVEAGASVIFKKMQDLPGLLE